MNVILKNDFGSSAFFPDYRGSRFLIECLVFLVYQNTCLNTYNLTSYIRVVLIEISKIDFHYNLDKSLSSPQMFQNRLIVTGQIFVQHFMCKVVRNDTPSPILLTKQKQKRTIPILITTKYICFRNIVNI